MESLQPKRMVIIGGGASGLAAAYRASELARENDVPLEIVILEASARLGGIVRTTERDGFTLEGGPDSFISDKPELLALVKESGFADRLIETNHAHRRAYIVRRNRLVAVPEGFQLLAPSRFWPFVTTDIFSWQGKARMSLDLLLPRRRTATREDDDETLAEFVRRRLGREALERMAQPMVGGIYTADPELLSLRATMPRFLEMEREHRSLLLGMWRARRRNAAQLNKGTSGARYSLFLSFDRGMRVLIDELSARLDERKVSVRMSAPAAKLEYDETKRRWTIYSQAHEALSADAVCLALSAYAAAQLLSDVDKTLAAELNSISYASTATLNLAYRRDQIAHPLDGFGFVTPLIEGRATLACSFSSVKFAGRAPAHHVLLRAFLGGALQPEIYALDDDQLIARAQDDLRDLLGISGAPLFAHLERWPRSMAQYHLGHTNKTARIRERLSLHPTLALAGNAYNGAGLPDCVRSGEKAARNICAALNANITSPSLPQHELI